MANCPFCKKDVETELHRYDDSEYFYEVWKTCKECGKIIPGSRNMALKPGKEINSDLL